MDEIDRLGAFKLVGPENSTRLEKTVGPEKEEGLETEKVPSSDTLPLKTELPSEERPPRDVIPCCAMTEPWNVLDPRTETLPLMTVFPFNSTEPFEKMAGPEKRVEPMNWRLPLNVDVPWTTMPWSADSGPLKEAENPFVSAKLEDTINGPDIEREVDMWTLFAKDVGPRNELDPREVKFFASATELLKTVSPVEYSGPCTVSPC